MAGGFLKGAEVGPLLNLSLGTIGRYIKTYEDVLLLPEKGSDIMKIVRVTGRVRSTILQYRKLAYLDHPELDSFKDKGELGVTKDKWRQKTGNVTTVRVRD